MNSIVTNEDCMIGMARYPDGYFDLAIVDPPYGIGNALVDGGGTRKAKFDNNRISVEWDKVPDEKYFTELFRISKNQIIWGSNYFNLPPTRCNIIWDKVQEFTGSDFELAWTSFNKASKAFRMSRVEAYSLGKIHPTQKPVDLYRWILENYATCKRCKNKGFFWSESTHPTHDNSKKFLCDCIPVKKILDTHLGSGSSRLAAHDMGFDFTGFELDKDYFEAAEKRYQNHIKQLTMFPH